MYLSRNVSMCCWLIKGRCRKLDDFRVFIKAREKSGNFVHIKRQQRITVQYSERFWYELLRTHEK